ncbi:MAG: PDGLE domain-containing protein [Candidatus Omnitrophica bacterium]|nr:PDGLE domain-containing protein [Candidatus Omnitrophota bacterium]
MNKKRIFLALITAMFLAIFISPFAAKNPDGLEKVAQDKGFIEKGEINPKLPAPYPDYTYPGLKNKKLSASFSGAIGTVACFCITYGAAVLIKRNKFK